jgi:cytochrome b involved in lipid metabolism
MQKVDFSTDEIARHSSRESCWLVANGRVYDATKFLSSHPAGADVILKCAGGNDCSKDLSLHSKKARIRMQAFRIGTVKGYEEPGCIIC